jgi:hypothetical protein
MHTKKLGCWRYRFFWDETHMVSPIRWHSVWNTEKFFIHYDLTMIIVIWFLLSCSLWHFSISRWNEYEIEVVIPEAAESRALVCGRSFAGIDFEFHRGRVRLSLVSVVYCQIEVLASGWPLVLPSVLWLSVMLQLPERKGYYYYYYYYY